MKANELQSHDETGPVLQHKQRSMPSQGEEELHHDLAFVSVTEYTGSDDLL